jgi:hypothetical protein
VVAVENLETQELLGVLVVLAVVVLLTTLLLA